MANGCKALAPDEVMPITVFTAVHFLAGYLTALPLRRVSNNKYQTLGAFALIAGHTVFEWWEGTQSGIDFFNLKLWQDIQARVRSVLGLDLWCEYTGDSFANSFFDTIAFTLGIMVALRRR